MLNAVNYTASIIKNCKDRKQRGLIIWKAAKCFGVDYHRLAKHLSERSKLKRRVKSQLKLF